MNLFSLNSILIVMSILAILIGLMLSSSGSNAGLTALSGQDLELFRKTKDRGFVKLLQIIALIIFVVTIFLLLWNNFGGLSITPKPPADDTPEENVANATRTLIAAIKWMMR